jgi:hypothetical protein
MLSLITSLCTLAALFCLAGGVRVLRSLLRAPEGYEDEAGFHQVEDTAARAGMVAADLGRTSLHV